VVADAVEQPAAPAETEPVAAPTGETLLVQPFPVDQGLVDGEVTAPPAATTPSMVAMPVAPTTAPVEEQSPVPVDEGDQPGEIGVSAAQTPSAAGAEPDDDSTSEAVINTPATPAPQTGSAASRRARHAAATAQTPPESGTEAVATETPAVASDAAEPARVAPSGPAESGYEPVAIPTVEHAGGEPVAAPTGETVAHPDQPESGREGVPVAPAQQPTASSGEAWENVAVFARTPADAVGHVGEQATMDAPEESGEPVQTEVPWYAASVEGAVPPAADAAAPEARGASDSEPASAPTASTPEDQPEGRAVEAGSAEPVAGRPGETDETSDAPEEPAPIPWGDQELRRRIYTEVQEFVAAIARRDVNELASRYGIAGNDLAGLDEQLAGLSAPASDLTLYPVEQADDYVDDHHRLSLSELEGGGVVIASELWAHGASTGARLVAHWNPMGIYPFDFRHVSM